MSRGKREKKLKWDGPTAKWMRTHMGVETTVVCCEACGLHYKPSLGHACKRKKAEESV